MAFFVRGLGRRGGVLGLVGVKRKNIDDVIDLKDAALHEELIPLDESETSRTSLQVSAP